MKLDMAVDSKAYSTDISVNKLNIVKQKTICYYNSSISLYFWSKKMKKSLKTWTFFVEFIVSVAIISIVAYYFADKIPLWDKIPYVSLILGGLLMIIAVVFHIFGKKRRVLYLFSCLSNSIASGLFIASYYSYSKILPKLADILLPIIIVSFSMLIRCILVYLNKIGTIISIVLLGINFAATIALIVLWIINGGAFYPTMYFLLIPEFMQGLFLIAYLNEKKNILRFISFASYGYAIIIGLVVLIIISEGDVLDGFDLSSDSKKK